MFVDEARIIVRGGKGGNGCVSFRREKLVPRGGPDGGDGGRGGRVLLAADRTRHTLMDISSRAVYRAGDGRPGSGANRHGKNGRDVVIALPVGTIVKDEQSGIVLKDLAEHEQRFVVASGGRAGKGNKHFASATNRTPREVTPGRPGQERVVLLELKLVADVGIIGLPNAGKSTLISRLSSAHPKIADYPFTTLDPVLGIVEGPGFTRCVMVDIPGLVEGAHEGVGLGHQFLRHVERTRVLLHMVDITPVGRDGGPVDGYNVIRAELSQYSLELARKGEIVVANKIDVLADRGRVKELSEAIDKPVLGISAATGEGLEELRRAVFGRLEQMNVEREEV